MMVMAGWIGTDVKSALTSNDTILWLGCSWMPCICWIKSLLFCMWYGDFHTSALMILDSSLDVWYVTAPTEVESSTDSNATGWCVMMNT